MSCEFGDQMGSGVPDDWKLRSQKPRGGSTSPLEKYTTFLLTLIEGQPDLTLDEVVCAMRKRCSAATTARRSAACCASKMARTPTPTP